MVREMRVLTPLFLALFIIPFMGHAEEAPKVKKKSRSAEYIFVYQETDRTFPKLYRVLNADEKAADFQGDKNLTGTIPKADADAFFEKLRKENPKPLIVERMRSTSLEALKRNFHGMYFYDRD
jgi:hypothetical protein